MSKKLPKPAVIKVEKGSKVRVLRPNMWAGFEGMVERHTPEFNIVKVRAKDGWLEVGAQASELEILP